ncbi:MAG: Uma2 family endonuclease [Leptolyngbyaceae cyanobacterium SM1_3_5]|nr:Uma2 family endonuclease [Leptolyngbyaceae cyanobacterium SM1_3_5]
MASDLFDEYILWEPRTKLELIDGQLVVGKSATHSRRLLSQILRGWGLEAAIALAPETLWWQAMTLVFGAPAVSALDDLNFLDQQNWAASVEFEPDKPTLLSRRNLKRAAVKESVEMAFFRLEEQGKSPGRSIGSGSFVNRLEDDALMPDAMFFYDRGRNSLYEYYLDGSAEIVVEFITPGCEAHDLEIKRSRYQAAGVPELWTIDSEQEIVHFQRWVEGVYETQVPDANGRYAVASVPGLIFLPEQLWVQGAHDYRGNWNLFEMTPDLVLGDRIRSHASGIDWNRLPTQFSIGLEPVAIAFEDYLYWVPESKFEFVDGKPWIGCEPGVRGLTGMLLMSLGLLDALRLFHPQQWVAALLNTRTQKLTDESQKAQWRTVAQRAAELLRAEYGATRLAIAGDVIADRPLNFWSQLYLVAWNLPAEMEASYRMYQALRALSSDLEIVILEADDQLFPPNQQMIDAGVVEI